MKTIIIDDNDNGGVATQIRKTLNAPERDEKKLALKVGENKTREIDFSKDDPREIAQAIIDTYPELKKPDTVKDINEQFHILINVEGKFGRTHRQEQKGVEILFWLRCKHRIHNPVILYGFQSNQQLLKRKPEHLIINSEGCYYVQLPYNFTELMMKDLRGVRSLEKLKTHLKTAINIEILRHQMANVWGLYRLVLAHNQLYPEQSISEDATFTVDVRDKMCSLQLSITEFLFRTSDKGDTNVRDNIRKKIDNRRDQIRKLSPIILYVEDIWNWGKALEVIFSGIGAKQFESLIPDRQLSEAQLIEAVLVTIQRVMPTCVLLDLRLRNEIGVMDNVNNISGAKLLKAIKTQFSSLPVIMVTATSKARTIKKLFDLGCDNVWVKEGLDERMSLTQSMNNYNELIEYVFEATGKFSNKTEKKLFEIDVEMTRLQRNLDRFDRNVSEQMGFSEGVDFFLNFDVVLTDANVWLETEKTKEYQQALLFIAHLLKTKKKEFVLHDDARQEIVRFAGHFLLQDYDINRGGEDPALILTARYSMNRIYRYQDMKLLKIVEIRRTGRVYADSQFSRYIPKQIEEGKSVLFITNDIDLIKNVKTSVDAVMTSKTNKLGKYIQISGDDAWDKVSKVVESLKELS